MSRERASKSPKVISIWRETGIGKGSPLDESRHSLSEKLVNLLAACAANWFWCFSAINYNICVHTQRKVMLAAGCRPINMGSDWSLSGKVVSLVKNKTIAADRRSWDSGSL